MLPVVGLIVQTVAFTVGHPYNIIGIVEIVISGLIYGLVCLRTRGIETASALHIVNNMTTIFMAGFGFGSITSEATVPDTAINIIFKILFFIFIIYADRKLHWFDKAKAVDIR